MLVNFVKNKCYIITQYKKVGVMNVHHYNLYVEIHHVIKHGYHDNLFLIYYLYYLSVKIPP